MPTVAETLAEIRSGRVPLPTPPEDRSLTIFAPPSPKPVAPELSTVSPPQTVEQALAEIRGERSGFLSNLQAGIDVGAPLAGGLFGGAVGAAGMNPATMVIGAGFGAAGGAAAANITRPFLTGDAPPPSLTGLPNTIEEGLLSAAGGPLATGIASGVGAAGRAISRKVLDPLRRSVTPAGREVNEFLGRFGGRLTPGQLTESKVIDTAENIAEGSFFGGSGLMQIKEKLQPEWLQKAATELVDTVGTRTGNQAYGAMLTDTVGQNRKMVAKVAKTMYGEVDTLARNVKVDTDPVVSFIKKGVKAKNSNVEKALAAAFPDGGWQAMLVTKHPGSAVIIRPGGQRIGQSTPPRIVNEASFQLAQEARSRLLRIGRRKPLSAEDEAVVSTARHIGGLLDKAIEDTGSRLAPDALDAFRRANEFYRVGQEKYNNEIIRAVVRKLIKRPEGISRDLLRPDNATTLDAVRAAVGPNEYSKYQARFATSMLNKSTDKMGVVDGSKLVGLLNSLGDETLSAAFTHDGAKALKELAHAAQFVQTQQSTKVPGRMLIQMKTGQALGVAGSLAFGGASAGGLGGAAVILGGPVVLGKLLASPKAVKLLLAAQRTTPGTRQFSQAVGQLMTLANDLGQNDPDGLGDEADSTLSRFMAGPTQRGPVDLRAP